MWRVIGSGVRGSRVKLVVTAICMLGSTVAYSLAVRFGGTGVDQLLAGADGRPVLVTALALAASGALLWSGSDVVIAHVATDLAVRLRSAMVHHALALPMGFFTERSAGEITDRISTDVDTVSSGIVNQLKPIAMGALGAASAFLFSITVDWRLTALFVPAAAVIVWAGWSAGHEVASRTREVQAGWADAAGTAEEAFGAREDLRQVLGRGFVMRRWAEHGAQLYAARGEVSRARNRLTLATAGAVRLFQVVVLLGGAHLAFTGQRSAGDVWAAFGLVSIFARRIEEVLQSLPRVSETVAAAQRIDELLDESPEPVRTAPIDEEHAVRWTEPVAVTFDDVSFRYDDGPLVLDHVTIGVRPGRTLALVGRTGSGKSTLGKLVNRSVATPVGTVRIDGVDVCSIPIDELRRNVGVVSQRVELVGSTLRDNITLFDPSITDAAIDAALDHLGLARWLQPEQGSRLDLELGEGATVLSSGEEQLVAFARLLVRNPAVVLLDEATARLDPVTESTLQEATDRLLAGRTSIVIAHRLDTIAGADDVVVLDDGRVVEHGARAALLANPTSAFRQLVEAAGAPTPDPAGAPSLPTRIEPEAGAGAAAAAAPRRQADAEGDDLDHPILVEPDPVDGESHGEPSHAGGRPTGDDRDGTADPDGASDAPVVRSGRRRSGRVHHRDGNTLAPPVRKGDRIRDRRRDRPTRVGRVTRRMLARHPRSAVPGLAGWATFFVLPGVTAWTWSGLVGELNPGGDTRGLISVFAAASAVGVIGRLAGEWYFSRWWNLTNITIRGNLLAAQLHPDDRRAGRRPRSPGDAVSRMWDSDAFIQFTDHWVDLGCCVALLLVTTALSGRWSTAPLLVAPIVLPVLVTTLMRRPIEEVAIDHARIRGEWSGRVAEVCAAATTVKGFGAEPHVEAHLADLTEQRQHLALRLRHQELTVFGSVFLVSECGQRLLLLAVASAIVSGSVAAGDVATTVGVAVASAEALALMPIAGIVACMILIELPAVRAKLRRFERLCPDDPDFDLTRPPPDLRLPPAPVGPVPTDRPDRTELHALSLRGAGVTYADGTRALDDIDLTIERGQLVIVTGALASGKSTLLRVLAGLCPLTDGDLTWDGTTVDSPSMFLRPPNCSYVSQAPRLVSGSVADNVALDHDVDVAAALRLAELDRDIDRAGGATALVGHRGLRLSGGQVQRMAAARATAGESELLVLDDLSSALDVVTERLLWQNLREAGQTVVATSYKRSALELADQVVVLRDGRVDAIGPLRTLEPTHGHLFA